MSQLHDQAPDVPAASRPPTALAGLISAVMREQGLTLRQVAEAGGLSIASVAALRASERGKRPRPATLTRLALGLRVPVEVIEASLRSDGGARQGRLLELFSQLSPKAQQQLLGHAEALAGD